MSETERADFLANQVFSMTLMATAQRGRLYSAEASEERRHKFQRALRQALDAVAKRYVSTPSDAVHEGNIVKLADSLSASHGATLREGRFRIGSAQKALNLFLKYRWCMGQGPEPPHCPFDARIINQLPPEARCAWTALDSIEDYRRLVAAARTLAGGGSLAEWELAAYNGA